MLNNLNEILIMMGWITLVLKVIKTKDNYISLTENRKVKMYK